MNPHTTPQNSLYRYLFLVFLLATAAMVAADETGRELRVVITQGGEQISGLRGEEVRLTMGDEVIVPSVWEEITPSHPAAGLRALVFIDEAFVVPHHRDRALAEFRRNLEDATGGVLPRPTLAVAAFDGEKVEFLTPWTSSREELIAAFEAAARRPTFGLLRESERLRQRAFARHRSRLPDAGSFSGTGFAGSTQNSWGERDDQVANLLRRHARRSAQAAAKVLEAQFEGPGHGGAFLLLGGGWLPPTAPAAECETLAEPLLEALARFGVVAYPVDLAASQQTSSRPPPVDGLLLRLAEISGGVLSADVSSALHRARLDAGYQYRLRYFPNSEEYFPNSEEEARGGDFEVEILRPDVVGQVDARFQSP